MAASFAWVESQTNATSTATPTNFNMGSTVAANLSPSTWPITAGNYSAEKWIRAHFTGTFTSVDNLQFWKSAGTLVTGEVINWTGEQESYVAPTTAASSYATTALVTTSGTANVGFSGTTTGSLTASGFSDFIVLQSSISTAASSGSANSKTFSFAYDET